MKLLRAFCTVLALGIVTVNVFAAAPSNRNALIWIQRMNQAAKSLNYQGVFFHEAGGNTETSQVIHFVDATGEHEKVQSIKGTSREIIRNNDEAMVYLAQEHLVISDRAYLSRFPNKITMTDLFPRLYSIQLGNVSQVAGRNAREMTLVPRDNMRYSRELWFDSVTGLLLKARMLDNKGNEIEKFGFEQIEIDPKNINRLSTQSQYGAIPVGWTSVNTRGQELKLNDLGWAIRNLPLGFELTSAYLRPIRLNAPPVYQLLVSDGIASISVFIEPVSAAISVTSSEPSLKTSVGIYKRVMADYQITTVGDAPSTTLKKVADGVVSLQK